MKISTLVFSFLVMAFTASAQFVIVNSPGSIGGVKSFSAAAFGANLNSGLWTADVVFVDDGSANPNQGCNAIINGAEVAGKIALIDRGGCEFGLKCLNAEQGGAIAVVVFNNAAGAGTIVMGAGAVGASVTIPSVMLSYEDGQIIRNALATGPVNMSIGAYKFPYDIGTDRQNIMNAPMGVIPTVQAEESIFTVVPAAIIKNKGQNEAVNVTLSATVDYAPIGGSTSLQVYDESASLASLAVDSSDIIDLPDFVPTEGGGIYDISYVLSSDNDDNPEVLGDNEISSRFILTDNVYCKGGWDLDNNRPARTNAYTISGGGNIEFLSGFYMPKGEGYRLDSMQFYVSSAVNFGALEPGSINGYVYQWIDANLDSAVTNNELVFVGFAPVENLDSAATDAWLTIPILETVDYEPGYLVDEDDAKFFVGVRYQGAELVYFGFDENYDQTVYTNYLAQQDLDLSYIGINSWDNLVPNIESGFLFTGFRGSAATALYISQVASSNTEKAPIAASVSLFPNPTSSILTVETDLLNNTRTVEYTIRDVSGRMVFSTEKDVNGTYDKAQFDVSRLAAGQYFLTLKTAAGSTSRPFAVKR